MSLSTSSVKHHSKTHIPKHCGAPWPSCQKKRKQKTGARLAPLQTLTVRHQSCKTY